MTTKHMTIGALVMTATLLGAGLAARPAQAALPKPAPTPAQQEAAAAKKAKADAQAAKDKQELADSMDAVSAHWRAQAAAKGWKSHPPVAIAAPAAAINTAANGGSNSGANSGAAAGQTPGQPAGQPAAQAGAANVNPPIRSEKLGTAPPSADVKAHPTQAQPANAPPAVVKGTPKVKNR